MVRPSEMCGQHLCRVPFEKVRFYVGPSPCKHLLPLGTALTNPPGLFFFALFAWPLAAAVVAVVAAAVVAVVAAAAAAAAAAASFVRAGSALLDRVLLNVSFPLLRPGKWSGRNSVKCKCVWCYELANGLAEQV